MVGECGGLVEDGTMERWSDGAMERWNEWING
jgi:hypothetical protein